jgi:hypothetical protein
MKKTIKLETPLTLQEQILINFHKELKNKGIIVKNMQINRGVFGDRVVDSLELDFLLLPSNLEIKVIETGIKGGGEEFRFISKYDHNPLEKLEFFRKNESYFKKNSQTDWETNDEERTGEFILSDLTGVADPLYFFPLIIKKIIEF